MELNCRMPLVLLMLPLTLFSQISETDMNSGWQFRKKGESKWLPAVVPGNIHSDLFRNKQIEDPFFGDNEKKIQWIENEDWEYSKEFTLKKSDLNHENIELEFEGLDTYAKIYLNDSFLFYADNMFRSWSIDVKKYLIAGTNNLHVNFESPVRKGRQEASKLSYKLPGDEKVFTRKAAFQY
ncbi:MAG: glycosyl hydrolase 2 galactose-binding domain-containing protein, partial [Bacteroidia bacterium]